MPHEITYQTDEEGRHVGATCSCGEFAYTAPPMPNPWTRATAVDGQVFKHQAEVAPPAEPE